LFIHIPIVVLTHTTSWLVLLISFLSVYVHIAVLYLQLIIFSVGDDVSVDSKTLLMTDFVNLKIKLTQSFRGAYIGSIYMHVIIDICVYTVFLKKYCYAT
jgi:hypothetical protein